MRRLLLTGLAALAISLPAALVPAQEAQASWYEYVCTESTALNMRSGPSVGYRVIGSIPKGHNVRVIQPYAGNGFAFVEYRGNYGYVAYGYLCFI